MAQRPGARRKAAWAWCVGLLLVGLAAGGGYTLGLSGSRQEARAPTGAAALQAGSLSLPAWLAGHAPDWRVGRLREHPAVLVIEFPDLHSQGAAMNRLAALLEKAGLPQDRLLNDAELAAAIDRSGENPQTYYLGHDYDNTELARFFALAARQQLPLSPQEQRLRQVLLQTGVLVSTPEGLQPLGAQALVSFTATQADDPATPQDETVDERRREAVLHHEISHGRYVTQPAYRAHAWQFWLDVLSTTDRAAIRTFLADLGYNQRDEELMVNEAQAFLFHTPDSRAFNAAVIGVSEAQLDSWRAHFWRTLPAEANRPAPHGAAAAASSSPGPGAGSGQR